MPSETQDPTKQPATGADGTKTPEAVKPEEKKVETPETPKPPASDDSAEKRIKELNEENKKHRLEAKEAKEKAARAERAFNILSGKPENETPDPVALEKAKSDNKVRRAYLKASFVTETAAVMHDASFAFDAMERQFADVKVDLDTGEVDSTALKSKLIDVKKTHGFLFKPEGGGGGGPTNPPKNAPDGGGVSAGAATAYRDWVNLKAAGRLSEAQEHYNKNKAAILAGWPK